MKQINKGFTLVEMMVVISIISLLSSVVLSAVNGARKKADDTAQIQAVQEYHKAFALAYDKYGGYPYAGDGINKVHSLGTYSWSVTPTVSTTINGVAGESLATLPVFKWFVLPDEHMLPVSFGGPFYLCSLLNGLADNKGACAKADILWNLPVTNILPSSSNTICRPGVFDTYSDMLAYGYVPICKLVLD